MHKGSGNWVSRKTEKQVDEGEKEVFSKVKGNEGGFGHPCSKRKHGETAKALHSEARNIGRTSQLSAHVFLKSIGY